MGSPGRVFGSAVTQKQGVVQICDSPEGLIDIQVGGELCGAVFVKRLTKWWLQTRFVYVTYQNCSGEGWAVPGGCRYTIRVTDADGRPVSGVRIRHSNSGSGLLLNRESDQYGRIFATTPFGDQLTMELERDGYERQRFIEPCTAGADAHREPRVVIRRMR